MAGLTGLPETPRTGRNLIAKVLKGSGTGISHVAVGRGTGVAGGGAGPSAPFGFDSRIGNNLEMLWLNNQSAIVHNDFGVFNTTANGIPSVFYFVDITGSATVNNQRDVVLTFGTDETGSAILSPNAFNHIFLVHVSASSPAGFGIGTLLCAPTSNATMPVTVPDVISYIGYVECDTAVKSVFNPARMFQEVGRTTAVTIDYLGDRAINGTPTLELLQPNLLDVSAEPNPSLLVRARFNLGVTDSIREMAVFGNAGDDLLAWGPVLAPVGITPGQGIFVRWGLGF